MKTLKSIGRILVLALVGLVLGMNLYAWNARSLLGNSLPMPFGYGAAVVLSGSMEPAFYTGDLIVVREADSLAVDDIVVYQDGSSLVVHRIIAMEGDTITTKGDANNTADDPVSVSAVKGTVLFSVPYAGRVVAFLKSPVGIVCILVAAFALIEIPRRREKQRDEDERQKLIAEIIRLKNEQQ